ncbi:MAG: single-stranded DNA-binding protein [Anaerolineae bacterium]|nr:single-stranded DNA-binding protein [Anaerolineae bacterium]
MSRGLNKVMLIGQLDGVVEMRHTPGGRVVSSFALAVPREWLSAEGKQHYEIDWFNIVAWNNLAEFCHQLESQCLLYVEGRLQTRSWEDESGKKHFRTEVVAHEVLALVPDFKV